MHWFLLLIGPLVFFHELGHFIFAKVFNVKVIRFSLGFGPRLFGFHKGETEYQISALPLGGYVKMLGAIPGFEIEEERTADDTGRALSEKPLWQRSIIIAAGPIFNFVLAFCVYVFMFMGEHDFADTKLGVVSPEDPAYQAGIRPGDKIVEVSGVHVNTFDELVDLIGGKPGIPLHIKVLRDGKEKTFDVTPAHRLIANAFEEAETRGRVGVSGYYTKAIIGIVDPHSPAAQGLKSGDMLLAVGKGQHSSKEVETWTQVKAWHELKFALDKLRLTEGEAIKLKFKRKDKIGIASLIPSYPPKALPQGDFSSANLSVGMAPAVHTLNPKTLPQKNNGQGEKRYTGMVSLDSVVASVEAGTPAEKMGLQIGDRLLALTADRQGKRIEREISNWRIDLLALSGVDARSRFGITVQRGTEVLNFEFKQEIKKEKGEFKGEYTRYIFGAENNSDASALYMTSRDVGLIEAMSRASRLLESRTMMLFDGIGAIFRGKVELQNALGGPVMLFVVAEKVSKQGMEAFLDVMAAISLQLGILNLLPIPVLDGGHLLLYGIEAVRRRPPSLKAIDLAYRIGFAIILTFVFMAFYFDRGFIFN